MIGMGDGGWPMSNNHTRHVEGTQTLRNDTEGTKRARKCHLARFSMAGAPSSPELQAN
jgi:hypothetical protein